MEMGSDESPSDALHEFDHQHLEAFDGQSREPLDPKLVGIARRKEIQYFKSMGVYDKVNISESYAQTGRAPVGVRWVDVNKGDSENPNHRSRLVAK